MSPIETLVRSADTWVGRGLVVPSLPPMQTVVAGAEPLGAAPYPIPTGAMFVDPVAGLDANPGTIESPKQTLVAASQAIKASGTIETPATVVLRGGVYHEGAYQPGNGYVLRWQAYPGEVVWLDGSSVVAGPWTDNGNGTYTAAYAAPAVPDLGTDNIGDDPNALLPDMCFFDGSELLQVADGATPAAGQFSVNRTTNMLTIASNPAGHEVRVSDIVYLTTSGSRIDMLGIGIRRYRCATNTLHTGIYFGGTSAGTIIENVRFEQMGRNALYVGKNNTTVRQCTFLRIGQTAILGDNCSDLLIEQCHIRQTDTGKWKAQPTSGAIKITVARRPVIRRNYLTESHNGNMIWLDVSCTQVDVYGNHVDGTAVGSATYSDSGICYEECDGGYWDGVQYTSRIVGNTVINCHKAIVVAASGNVTVSNNTIGAKWAATATAQAVLVLQDRDVNSGVQAPFAACPWWNVGVEVLNNVITAQANGWQLLAYDSQNEVPRTRAIAAGLGSASGQQIGGAMLSRVEGNLFAPASGSSASGSIMATVGRADGVRINLNTPAELGGVQATYGLTGQVGANTQGTVPDHDTAAPIPAAYAALVGLAPGTRHVGNPLPAPVVEE